MYGDDDDEVEGIKMSCNYDDEAGLAKSLTLALNGKSATLEHPFPLDGDYIEYYKVHSFAGTDFIGK